MLNKKSIFTLKLIFVLGCFFYSSKLFATFLVNDFKASNLKNISLYQYLSEVKNRFNNQAQVQKNDNLQSLSEKILSKMIDQVIEDFLCILNGFSQKKLFYNLEIEIRFFGICSKFKTMEEITPRLLREIKNNIKDFDDYLKKYTEKRNDFLEPNELNFIDTMRRFNFLLSELFLKEDFLKLNFRDKFLDNTVYKPWETVCEKGKFVVTVLILGAATLGYFLWPELKRILSEKNDTTPSYKNTVSKNTVIKGKNLDIKIEQLKALRQRGATCGFHALRNVFLAMFFDKQEDIEKKMISNEKWKELLKEMQKITKDKDWVHGDQLKVLCNPRLIVQWKEYLGVDLSVEQATDLLNRIVIVDDIDRIENLQGITEKLSNCIYDFRAGLAQGLLIRSAGHWYAAKIQKSVDKDTDSINVLVANSLSYNLTSDSTLDRIVKFFANREIPTPQMLEVGNKIDGCYHILTTLDTLEGDDSPSARKERVVNELVDMITIARENDFGKQPVFKKIYGVRIKRLWDMIKNSNEVSELKEFFENNLAEISG